MFDSSSGTLKLSKIEAGLSFFAPLKVAGKESSVHPNQSSGNDHKQPCNYTAKPQQAYALIEDDLPFTSLVLFSGAACMFSRDKNRDHVYQPKKGGHVPFAV